MKLTRAPWYLEFFEDDYLKTYGDLLTEEQTTNETNFIEANLDLKKGAEILDLCCGEGRHSIALASRGYRVTSLDLSPDYLRTANEMANERGVSIKTVLADMRESRFFDQFDAVINMFTAFGYLESETEDLKVLDSASRALKPGGKLLLDTINREWVMANNISTEWRTDDNGTVHLESREMDLETSLNHVTFTTIDTKGNRDSSVGHHIRMYTLTEMINMFQAVGLKYQGVYGGFDGESYSRNCKRMIVVGKKPHSP